MAEGVEIPSSPRLSSQPENPTNGEIIIFDRFFFLRLCLSFSFLALFSIECIPLFTLQGTCGGRHLLRTQQGLPSPPSCGRRRWQLSHHPQQQQHHHQQRRSR